MKLLIAAAAAAATLSYPAAAQSQIVEGEKRVEISASEPRPNCDYKFGSSSGWINLTRFYKESMREDLVGSPIKTGGTLIYLQLREVDIAAAPLEQIENRDRSPLNPNWKWPQNKTLKVWSTVTFDGGATWYKLIGHTNDSIKISYWTIKHDGFMCSNVLSYEKKAQDFVTSYGMSRIYQNEPLNFNEIEKPDGATISISIAVKEIVGPVASIQTNVALNGKSIFSKMESIDTYGGGFEVAKIPFTTKRVDGQNLVESIQIPADLSRWLHHDLKISQRY